MNRPRPAPASTPKVTAKRTQLHVERVMVAFWEHSSRKATTPGGASWLYIHQVPVRRLVTQLVRKLLELDAAYVPPVRMSATPSVCGEDLIALRATSSREYRSYTVTDSGIAFALGTPPPYMPARSSLSTGTTHVPPLPNALCETIAIGAERLPSDAVVALSWSSRHAETLLPVLQELSRHGRPSVIIDLATDASDRCPNPSTPAITVWTAPTNVLSISGTVPRLWPVDQAPFGEHATVRVGPHAVLLDRLGGIAGALLERAGGCTQPSWASTVAFEAWLDELLAEVRPNHLLLANDTSPLGAIAVHAAERRGITSTLIQHGAWVPGSVAVEALHSRRIVVMGRRDVRMAKAWARHPDAEIHALGQPRLDRLDLLDRDMQRDYLQRLLGLGPAGKSPRIAVWACQPFSPQRLQAQADIIRDALLRVKRPWGLVVAPHPAQSRAVLDDLMRRLEEPSIALADPAVGARGCLAGADALISVSSTCGIEAILLEVPVVELRLAGERSLRLAEQEAACSAHTASDVAAALDQVVDGEAHVAAAARDAVCVRRGHSAAAIAQLVMKPAAVGARYAPTYEPRTRSVPGSNRVEDEEGSFR
ncbi:hypothetical protein ACWGR4_01670 [Embleya sp. NPDC055664]